MKDFSELSFEAAISQLEASVRALEGGKLSLDELLLGYEEAIALSRRCHALLEDAKARVTLLTSDGSGRLSEVPFEGEAE